MNKTFDLKNIYSKQNAEILEDLLDKKIAPLAKIAKIFLPSDLSKSDANAYLMRLIPSDLINRLTNNDTLLDVPLQYVANVYEDQVVVCADKMLPLMLRQRILPAEIAQLPRRSKEKIGFDIIEDYYENRLSYRSSSVQEIIYHPDNYSHTTPLTLTYYEALSRIEDSGLSTSWLERYASQMELKVYLRVGEDSTIDDCQIRNYSRQSIEFFRNYNCGNPSYTTRHKGLEALKSDQVLRLFEGNTIKIQDNEFPRRSLAVQSTDREKKHHLQRFITSCIQIENSRDKVKSNKFQLKDTLYLSEDIGDLILFAKQSTQLTADKIYSFQLSPEDIRLLREELQKNPKSTLRIKNQVQRHINRVEKTYPRRSIEKAKVARRLHQLEKSIYADLGLKQPKEYTRYTRN